MASVFGWVSDKAKAPSGYNPMEEGGRFSVSLGSHFVLSSTKTLSWVEGFTLYDSLNETGYREAGVYEKGTAEAEVNHEVDIKGVRRCRVTIRGKELNDVLGLFREIRVGSIQPTESYEGAQTGKSRVELEAELESIRVLLAAAEEDSARLRETIEREREVMCNEITALKDELKRVNALLAAKKAETAKLTKVKDNDEDMRNAIRAIGRRLSESTWPWTNPRMIGAELLGALSMFDQKHLRILHGED